jgi:hypothetical protein
VCLLLNPSLSSLYIGNARSGGRNAAELHAKIRKSFSGYAALCKLLLLSAGRCCCRVIEKGYTLGAHTSTPSADDVIVVLD